MRSVNLNSSKLRSAYAPKTPPNLQLEILARALFATFKNFEVELLGGGTWACVSHKDGVAVVVRAIVCNQRVAQNLFTCRNRFVVPIYSRLASPYGHLVGAVVLSTLTTISGLLSFLHEYRSSKAADALKQMVHTSTVVTRLNEETGCPGMFKMIPHVVLWP